MRFKETISADEVGKLEYEIDLLDGYPVISREEAEKIVNATWQEKITDEKFYGWYSIDGRYIGTYQIIPPGADYAKEQIKEKLINFEMKRKR